MKSEINMITKSTQNRPKGASNSSSIQCVDHTHQGNT